ncbi:signal peptidase I [Psychrobium sp. 1_MG-2023]|uniref:signal peptidase I n=1 Tax=Psychrobium sp. 1_MG-2023 TaxID=3062624 RepID=UPI00273388F5|nr:signal peptidase I [Psychrobium sp. 1_MG-2023]MDP2560733.1 signal peptidase I [Psychrobium sp. 1_MG-2023]
MNKLKKTIKENRGFLLFILLMSVFRSAVADYNSVPTGSMLPTIIPGDQIVIDKLAYDVKVPFINHSLVRLNEPKRGEIVVFESAAAESRMVKRVIGEPGDKVALINNRLIINGQAVSYGVVGEDADILQLTEQLPNLDHEIQVYSQGVTELDSFGEVVVPQDKYLVLGDNRQDSADSRVYGFVPRDEIIGRATKVLISFNYQQYYAPRNERSLMPLI